MGPRTGVEIVEMEINQWILEKFNRYLVFGDEWNMEVRGRKVFRMTPGFLLCATE